MLSISKAGNVIRGEIKELQRKICDRQVVLDRNRVLEVVKLEKLGIALTYFQLQYPDFRSEFLNFYF